MSNKTRLQTNNANLQALINKANALPDAGGSGGGICTITVQSNYPIDGIYYQSQTGYDILTKGSLITINAACGSFVYIVQSGFYAITVSSGEVLYKNYGCGAIYKVPISPTSVTINIVAD